MDHAAESVVATEAIELENFARGPLLGRCGCGERWPLPERSVRPVLVVVERVDGKDALEMPTAE